MKIKYDKNKILPALIVLSSLFISVFIYSTNVTAQESQVSFPVKELGNCENKETCKQYCDKSENSNVCLDFARKNKLMSEDEIKVAESILLKDGGPGGCSSKSECEAYCDNISNMDQCISFAEKYNLIPPGELEEARKMQAAMRRGVKPPPCKNKKDCDSFCSEPNNMEICMNFAVEAGFMSETEKVDAQKMLQALKKGVKPLPCKNKEDCEEYCSQEGNMEQCVSFAEAAGFMSPEQAARTRKTGGKGPGGCKGKECETFCNDEKNQEICFQYSVDNGLISEADQEKMKEGSRQGKSMLEKAPPEVVSCIKSKIGESEYQKMMNGQYSRQTGDPFRACFDQYMNAGGGRGPRDEGRGEERREERGEERREYDSPMFTPPPGSDMFPPQQGSDIPMPSPSPEPMASPTNEAIPEPMVSPISEPTPEINTALPPPPPTGEERGEIETTAPQSLLRTLGGDYSLATVFEAVQYILGDRNGR